MLKWPNDVVVDDRKLAGILCEAKWERDLLEWMAIGIGINVHGPLPAEIARQAIALEEVVPSVTRIVVLEQLAPLLHDLSDEPTLATPERVTYAQYDWLVNRKVSEPVAGTACGIDGDGALLVKTENGMERVLGGSVVAA
jgi:BirA family biotin operon repressor/biotin-[acetyl-CoA-carboxylase] ligase